MAVSNTDTADSICISGSQTAMNIGNANTAVPVPQHQPSAPIPFPGPNPSVSVHPAPTVQPVPPFPFSSAPMVPALESHESIGSNNLVSCLVKPSLFSHSAAAPLHPSVTMQRPYGTPLLQPFPPPTPPPSLTPTQNSGPAITRDKVRDALLRLVQNDQFIDMVYREILMHIIDRGTQDLKILDDCGWPVPQSSNYVPVSFSYV